MTSGMDAAGLEGKAMGRLIHTNGLEKELTRCLINDSSKLSRSGQNAGIQGFVQWVDRRGEVPRRMFRSARLCSRKRLNQLTLHSVVTPKAGNRAINVEELNGGVEA
jgi:hypothetical protein